MENKTYFFREYEEVEKRIEIVKNYLNSDDENEIVKHYLIILDNLKYLSNCLNSYREIKNVLDPHLALLVHSFLFFLKNSFNHLKNICTYFNAKLEYEKRENNNYEKICEEKKNITTSQKITYDENIILLDDNNTNEKKEVNENKVEEEEILHENKKIKMYIIIEEIYKYYYTLISVRGEKKIKTLYPCESFYLNSIVDLLLIIKKEENTFNYINNLKSNKTDENNGWTILYILIIWLSFCLYIPFKLININTFLLNNIEEIYYYYIKKDEKSKEACSVLYSQFLSREDVYKTKTYFNHFLIFSKEIMIKLIEIETKKNNNLTEDIYIIKNANIPYYCHTKFSYLILYGILLTHKKILKKLDKNILRNYTNFYKFFFIQNHHNLDFTQTSKSLKILCLGYYALLFLEKSDNKEEKNNYYLNDSLDAVKQSKIRQNECSIDKSNEIFTIKNSSKEDFKLENINKNDTSSNTFCHNECNEENELFNEFPLYLNINDVFLLYKKSTEEKPKEKHIEKLVNIKVNKKYKCEKDIIEILNILFFYFNDNNSYIRWCLSKSFGNILIYLSSDNIKIIFNKFNELTKYNDCNILCSINYSLFHFIFNKNNLSIEILNFIILKIIQSLYTNIEKIYSSSFVLLYSLFKYNILIKNYYEQNDNSINFFLFHLIFIKLIILSLFEDNINIRKSAMSLLQFFIGKFNFLYEIKNYLNSKNDDNNSYTTTVTTNNSDSPITTMNNVKHSCDNVIHKNISTHYNNQEQLFLQILQFINLFFNHSNISNYYENIKSSSNCSLNEINDNLNCNDEEKIIFEKNTKCMNEIKKDIFNINIDLLSTCNFSELINLKKSIILKAKIVCNFFLYKYPVIYHLYSNKLFHENINIRILSSESLANLSEVDEDYFIKVILPFLIKKSYEENVLVKHGSIICISKILLKLKKNIDETLQNEIKKIIVYSEKKRIYKYKKGEILRHSLCLLIQSVCQCNYFSVKKNTYTFFMEVLHNNLFHYNEIIQFEASKIFYYMPIYILNKGSAIDYIYEVFCKIIKEKNNFLHLKGYLILLCFVNEEIIPHIYDKTIQIFYNILKKSTTYYKIKKFSLNNKMSKMNDVKIENSDIKINHQIKNDICFFKKINFDTYPIDFNMKIYCLLGLFNIIDKLRKKCISDFLKVYDKCTISFKGLIKSKNPQKMKLKKRPYNKSTTAYNERSEYSLNEYTENNANSNSENHKDQKTYMENIEDKQFSSESSSDDSLINYDDKACIALDCNKDICDKNMENYKKENEYKTNVKLNNLNKKKRRNTCFYMKKKINFVKKKIDWNIVLEKSKKKNIEIFNLNLNINKMIKVIILYLQEYVYENDIGDSHVYVREICLDLTAFLLTSFPLYFFKRKLKKTKYQNIKIIKEKKRENKEDEYINSINNSLSKNFFYEYFSSDDSYEDSESDDNKKDKVEKNNINLNKKEEEKNNYENNVCLYILFEIKKKNINMLIQLLLKLLCEKNVRTHKKCLFILNYLYNYAFFNERKEKECFSFDNIFNKYCHDFSYELFLRKKIDDNIRKSKINIYQFLSSYSTNIFSAFKNITTHVCDYYEPIYLKDKKDDTHCYNYMNSNNKKSICELQSNSEKKKINKCSCKYEEEITEVFLNENYKYDVIKTIFNKINNFIYLYNYSLKYTSFSIFHKNKFMSTRKALIKGYNSNYNEENEKKKINDRNNEDHHLTFDHININNDFIDEINLSENEEKISIEEEKLIKDVHFLLDKTKKNISVIKCLEYNETYLYNHVFYLLFLNKYNYYIINGFFNTLCYYSSQNEYGNYEYTNLMKKGKEKSIEFLFLEFLDKYKNIYTFGYIRDNILFLYIRYYKKYFINYDYFVINQIFYEYNKKKINCFYNYNNNNNNNRSINNDQNDNGSKNILKMLYNKYDMKHIELLKDFDDTYFSLYDYNLQNINLKEIILSEKKYENYNFLKNIFNNYNIFFDSNIIFINDEYENVDKDKKKKEKKKRIKENNQIKREYHEKIELLQYVNICLVKILYYLNNFNLIQLEIFLKSVNSFVKFSIINNFAAFCFLNFFLFYLEKYNCYTLIKTISELIINIFMCPYLHLNIKKFAVFLILNLLLHRYPKIREFTNDYLYTNINFISPNEIKNYLFNSYEDLENIISILINTQFSDTLNDEKCHISIAVKEIAEILRIPHYITFSSLSSLSNSSSLLL
ncbi:conserved Plasmodium protein, unknown function [Plasmodium gallinaceum]|uniref:Uncharacterized protein n=1 Tax=Plasmodium gallinaceum TaxID=5849 RepID=A0A1J1GRH6_PLAGA|nr:conserved Plasmodium protein, unknown function [Plasmodium gallinaceum]CRG94899.1 conserved Plasmodium protein, unknown function [Plasmodium gallinaceum]